MADNDPMDEDPVQSHQQAQAEAAGDTGAASSTRTTTVPTFKNTARWISVTNPDLLSVGEKVIMERLDYIAEILQQVLGAFQQSIKA